MKFVVCWRDDHMNKGGSIIGKFEQAQATQKANELQKKYPERRYWTAPIAKRYTKSTH